MRRIRKSHDVPGVLDHKMLEASARANEGNAVLPRVLNGGKRAVRRELFANVD